MKVLVVDLATTADMSLIFEAANRLQGDGDISVRFCKHAADAIALARWFRPAVLLCVRVPVGEQERALRELSAGLQKIRPGTLVVYLEGRRVRVHEGSFR